MAHGVSYAVLAWNCSMLNSHLSKRWTAADGWQFTFLRGASLATPYNIVHLMHNGGLLTPLVPHCLFKTMLGEEGLDYPDQVPP